MSENYDDEKIAEMSTLYERGNRTGEVYLLLWNAVEFQMGKSAA